MAADTPRDLIATTAAQFVMTASTADVLLRRYVPTQRPAPFKFRKIKREFQRDWHDVIIGAYQEIKGDAPPKRLNKERRRLMFALRRVLRMTSYQEIP